MEIRKLKFIFWGLVLGCFFFWFYILGGVGTKREMQASVHGNAFCHSCNFLSRDRQHLHNLINSE